MISELLMIIKLYHLPEGSMREKNPFEIGKESATPFISAVQIMSGKWQYRVISARLNYAGMN